MDAPTIDEGDWEESSDIEESLNAISDIESQPIPSQSSSIRPATEVDTIPGDKLHATLSEVEQCTVNPDGSIRNQTIEGELILRNSAVRTELGISKSLSTNLNPQTSEPK